MRAVAAWLLPLIVLLAGCSAPPQKEIDMAQGAIDAARAAGAEQYASDPFAAANLALKEANDAVTQRDYRLALARALDAHERAREAARDAADGKARARSEAEIAIVAGSTALQNLRDALAAADAAKVTRRELEPAQKTAASAVTTLQEARTALKNADYLRARQMVSDLPGQIAREIEGLDAVSKKPSRPVRRSR